MDFDETEQFDEDDASSTPPTNSPSDSPGDPVPSSIWDDDAALADLAMERQVHPNETNDEMTRRLLSEAGPHAARTIITLSQHAVNENTRLNAAKFVAEWAKEEGAAAIGSTWEQMLSGSIRQVEEAANEGSGN